METNMGKVKSGWEILEEAEAKKPENIIEIACPFTNEYFEEYRYAERKIMRNTEAYAEAYFSAANIWLH